MRKVFLSIMMAAMVVSADCQTLTKRETIANLALGGVKLEQIVQKGDTLYSMFIKTGNSYKKYIAVSLGNRSEALRLLNILNDVKLKGDDMLSLENVTDNIVTRGAFGCLRFYSEGRQFSGDIHKMYIRKMIEVLEGAQTESGKDDEE